MNNLPFQPLKWTQNNYEEVVTHTAKSPLHDYTIRYDELEDAYLIDYYERMTNEHGNEFFKSVDEAKNWAQSTHYKDKMQPYVKPMPTKVYELTYDCGDSYSTLFMTLDKQQAVDFMEGVKDADLDFIASYGLDCAADELLIEQYEDNHPLAPYKNQIFNSIYEDGFSEWMLNYGGNSLVSSSGIIEHELFSIMQNLHKGGDCE